MKTFILFFTIVLVISCTSDCPERAEIIVLRDSLIKLQNEYDSKMSMLAVQYLTVDSSKNELQKEFDEQLVRLDSLTEFNAELEGQLMDRNNELGKLKSDINSLLKRRRLSNAEMQKAKMLINELKDKVSRLVFARKN